MTQIIFLWNPCHFADTEIVFTWCWCQFSPSCSCSPAQTTCFTAAFLFVFLAATSADRFYRIDRSQVNLYLVTVSINLFLKLCHMQLKMIYLPLLSCILGCCWCLVKIREKILGLFLSWYNSHHFTELTEDLYLLMVCFSANLIYKLGFSIFVILIMSY